jgi:hypothetical protein
MADTISIDGGSPQRVAFDLWTALRPHRKATDPTPTADDIKKRLDLYVACLHAVEGRSKYDLSNL